MAIFNTVYGGEWKWKPWENTLLYMEFNNNLSDSSWKWVSMSWSDIWYGTIGDKKYVELTSNSWGITWPWNLMASCWTGDFAVSLWLYAVTTSKTPIIFSNRYEGSPYPWCQMFFRWDWNYLWFFTQNTHTSNNVSSTLVGGWHHLVFTRLNWTCNWYVDGVSWFTPRADSATLANNNTLRVLNRPENSWQSWGNTWAKMSELIVEAQWWTSSETQKYYNSIKSNYWL